MRGFTSEAPSPCPLPRARGRGDAASGQSSPNGDRSGSGLISSVVLSVTDPARTSTVYFPARLRLGRVRELRLGREVVVDDVDSGRRRPVELLPDAPVFVLDGQMNGLASFGPVGDPDGRIVAEPRGPGVFSVAAAGGDLDRLDREGVELLVHVRLRQFAQRGRLGLVAAAAVR